MFFREYADKHLPHSYVIQRDLVQVQRATCILSDTSLLVDMLITSFCVMHVLQTEWY